MRFLIMTFAALFLLLPAHINTSGRDWPSATVNGLPGVIMPRDIAESVIWSEDEIDGYWLPGEPWLEAADQAIADRAERIEDPQRTPVLGSYRQYGGFIENGERKIYINAFCVELDNWKRGYVMVMDGGPCFWNAVYNVNTGEVEHLYVNYSV